ncbi:MAG: hypothetical protein ABEJ93_02740 [Candidatus Nanohalobium sp.]
MWPGEEIGSPEEFNEKIKNLSRKDTKKEMTATIHALQQLVDRKYSYYRKAVQLMKIQIILIPTGLLLLITLTYL